jgi:hypothetical protein
MTLADYRVRHALYRGIRRSRRCTRGLDEDVRHAFDEEGLDSAAV